MPVKRLDDIKAWLAENRELYRLMWHYVEGRDRRATEWYRWHALAVGTTTTLLGALAGWLTDLLGTPQALLHRFLSKYQPIPVPLSRRSASARRCLPSAMPWLWLVDLQCVHGGLS